MAPDINLLPDEDRRAEERELHSPRGSRTGKPLYSQPGAVVAPAPLKAAPVAPPLPQPKLAAPQQEPEKKLPPKPKPTGKSFGQRLRGLLGSLEQPSAPQVSSAPPSLSLDLNLIPQEAPGPSLGALWPLVGAVLGAALVVGAAFVGLGLGISSRGRELAQAQAAAAAASDRLLGQQQAVEEMGRAVQQVRTVASLLDGHTYWNRYFTWLESVTLPDVYYSGFMGDVAGTFTLTASARDYVTLAQQLVALRSNPLVQQVSVAEASRDSQNWVNFTMSLTVSPEVFKAAE